LLFPFAVLIEAINSLRILLHFANKSEYCSGVIAPTVLNKSS